MSTLPDLDPPLARTADITVEVLRHPPIAQALSHNLSRLARVYRDCPEEAVFVRIAFSGGHLDGWYRPRAQEFEPTGLRDSQESA